ncbi:unnamed protein product [Rotaria sordida]|uniref:Uncharacterized protein n=1 Tax=Rotaria sordida TaxID=392033 RepID=A0A814QCN9_9BILA|nr:unnamed protein product [Rotaria sordida]
MQASSNNHYQKSLPFTDIQIHTNKSSEDDTGYDSLPNQYEKQQRINSIAGPSSSSSLSHNQYAFVMNYVENIPSPTDISTTNETSDIYPSVLKLIAEFPKKSQPTTTTTPIPNRKTHRTRVQPIPDSTSDSADSFAQPNHVVLLSSYRQQISQVPTISSINIPSFGGSLEYIHDNRYDSTTTVDHVKNDVIAIELMEQQQQQQPNHTLDTHLYNKQQLSWINRLGESIRLLPANVLAIVFIGLIGGLFVSAIFVIIIA